MRGFQKRGRQAAKKTRSPPCDRQCFPSCASCSRMFRKAHEPSAKHWFYALPALQKFEKLNRKTRCAQALRQNSISIFRKLEHSSAPERRKLATHATPPMGSGNDTKISTTPPATDSGFELATRTEDDASRIFFSRAVCVVASLWHTPFCADVDILAALSSARLWVLARTRCSVCLEGAEEAANFFLVALAARSARHRRCPPSRL